MRFALVAGAGLAVLLGACALPTGSATTEALPTAPLSKAAPDRVAGVAPAPAPFTADELQALLRLSPLPAVPPDPTNRVADDPRARELGRLLFFEPRLSRDGETSCASCHDPERGWADARPLPEKQRSHPPRHTPSLWNVAYQRWFGWDGRSDSLWAQALVPLESPAEHGLSRVALAHRLAQVPELAERYRALFGPLPELGDARRFPASATPHPGASEGERSAWEAMASSDRAAIDALFANVGKALAAFERTIVSDRAPFDRFVEGVRAGDLRAQRALSAEARRGAQLFVGEARCVLCHSGPLFSDREFHDTRLPRRSPRAGRDGGRYTGIALLLADPFRGDGAFSDDPGAGRGALEFLAESGHDWGTFRTPSLRNVARTAPYMHDGSFPDLESVVRFYSELEGAAPTHHRGARTLRALHLSADDQRALVAFLEALTDESARP